MVGSGGGWGVGGRWVRALATGSNLRSPFFSLCAVRGAAEESLLLDCSARGDGCLVLFCCQGEGGREGEGGAGVRWKEGGGGGMTVSIALACLNVDPRSSVLGGVGPRVLQVQSQGVRAGQRGRGGRQKCPYSSAEGRGGRMWGVVRCDRPTARPLDCGVLESLAMAVRCGAYLRFRLLLHVTRSPAESREPFPHVSTPTKGQRGGHSLTKDTPGFSPAYTRLPLL